MTDETAAQARDTGMDRAITHANRVHIEWSVRALAALRSYAGTHASFTIEQMRAKLPADFPTPPDARSWGGIAAAAASAGWLKSAGYQKSQDRSKHCAPVTLWQSRIVGAQQMRLDLSKQKPE